MLKELINKLTNQETNQNGISALQKHREIGLLNDAARCSYFWPFVCNANQIFRQSIPKASDNKISQPD